MDINTCFETTNAYHIIAFYSHLIPAVIALFLSVYTLGKTRGSKLAIIFFGFTVGFSLWLIGDLIIWVSPDYSLIYFIWSWLDYVNVVFFALGAYFFSVLARGTLSPWEKLITLLISIPALLLTVSGSAVTDFYQPWCEATENPTITYYKLFAEWIFILMMLISLFIAWKPADKSKRIQMVIMLVAILLFFGTFSVTEYIAVTTGIYEINLYGLFILPLFLIAITFGITNLGVFNIRYLGTQLLIYVLIIMVGSQFLFLQDSTDATLNAVTLVISIFLGLVLLQNAKRELDARLQIEKLASALETANERLKELDKMKSEFVSIASHQLRSPLTAIRGYASMILEGSYGVIPQKAQEAVARISESSAFMAKSVEDYLNVSRIQSGNMKYELSVFSLKDTASKMVDELRPVAMKRGLLLTFKVALKGKGEVKADLGKTRQIVQNLIDNAIKYTKVGSVTVVVRDSLKPKKVYVEVTDSGIGMSKETIEDLFGKFSRAQNANEVNVTGTGLGLFVAKKMAEEMGGTITARSEGEGKGSTFILEFAAVS